MSNRHPQPIARHHSSAMVPAGVSTVHDCAATARIHPLDLNAVKEMSYNPFSSKTPDTPRLRLTYPPSVSVGFAWGSVYTIAWAVGWLQMQTQCS